MRHPVPSQPRVPPLIRLFILHSAIGFGIAALFVALILWLDVARLGTLVVNAPGGGLAAMLLWLFNGTVFSTVQVALALSSLTTKSELPRRPVDLAQSRVPVVRRRQNDV